MDTAVLLKQNNKSLKEYQENTLFTDKILDIIESIHEFTVEKIYKNVYVKYNDRYIEFDVLLFASTPSGRKRLISIELKEYDIGKAIEQAIIRREFVDYSYIIMKLSLRSIIEYILYVTPGYIRNNRIGIFSGDTLLLASKYIPRNIDIIEKDKI